MPGVVTASPSSMEASLSSCVRRERLLNTTPSWMAPASGRAKHVEAARTASATHWQECPKMYSGLVLLSDS